jgi:hypothetical protein
MSDQVHPELAQKMASYIQETDGLIQELKAENLQLKQAATGCKKCGENPCSCGCDKQASEGAVEGGRITEVVDHLIQAGFLKESSRDQAISSVTANPATALLDFCDKLASQRIVTPNQLPRLGKAVDKPGQLPSAASEEKRASDKQFESTFDNLNA